MIYSESQTKYILILSLLVSSVLIFIMLYQSRGILLNDQSDVTKEDEGDLLMAILTSDSVSDQSWGSLAYKGQVMIEDEFPVDAVLHSGLYSEELVAGKAKEAIESGAELIIGHGQEFSPFFRDLAPYYPDVQFVTIHGTATYSNQAVYTFGKGKAEYFAGLAGALKSETGRIALIEIEDEKRGSPKFFQGVHHYKPEAEVFSQSVTSREDGAEAVGVMDELLKKGVDVIYSKGNAFNRDIIERAKEEDVYVIGYIEDQSYMAREYVLTSVTNDVPKAYVAILEDYFSKEGIPGGVTILGENEGVVDLAPFGPMFTKKELEFIESEIKRHTRGKLTF
ncbi:BMP family ABC transporter substrate-binding protein [Salipaludibacillus aurantiacus]|uniref:Transcriptional activator of comK protein n=1 Tax=Salipaludibacillus aurantiacus TaxID=1601833 RepID=A0A1H9WBD0_9BACI|nr:BMP family ABC transporter substrate-binding protein [Salipaludibacillus aurantiacus]SES30773.1 transcriptional activator of comK gene [Salipaludibacillus aurantiacus]